VYVLKHIRLCNVFYKMLHKRKRPGFYDEKPMRGRMVGSRGVLPSGALFLALSRVFHVRFRALEAASDKAGACACAALA
jgi:hypothetical protein